MINQDLALTSHYPLGRPSPAITTRLLSLILNEHEKVSSPYYVGRRENLKFVKYFFFNQVFFCNICRSFFSVVIVMMLIIGIAAVNVEWFLVSRRSV